MNWKQIKLEEGQTFITSEKGNSMLPLIKSGQEHELTPINWEECKKGDIVFCKIRYRYYTHLVHAVSDRGLLIGNNKGYLNGWTKSVYGKVTKVL